MGVCFPEACPFSTHNRIKEELVQEPGEEEDSPHLVADSPTSRWLHHPTTLWEPRGDHLQHLAQAALVC